jgi:hypothetical protein
VVCIVSLLEKIHGNQALVPINETWSARKTSRSDFLEKCDVSKVLNDQNEMKRRIKAFRPRGIKICILLEGMSGCTCPQI